MAEDQVPTLPDTVTVLNNASNDSVVYLVGTSHFTKKSQEDVAQVVNAVKPNIVVIAASPIQNRILSIDDLTNFPGISMGRLKESMTKFGVFQGIAFELVMSVLSLIFSRIGVVPYGEFRKAIVEAKKYHSSIHCGDIRNEITFKRAISVLSWTKFIRLVIHLILNIGLKIMTNNMIHVGHFKAFMFKIGVDYPELTKVIIEEREQFFTYNLQCCAGISVDNKTGDLINLLGSKRSVVVGVVESSHVVGIKKYWETITKEEVDQLIIIPPRSRSTEIVIIAIKVFIYGLFLWGVLQMFGVMKPFLNMFCI